MILSDTDLINKAQNGDESAFNELVCRYDRSVLSLALKYVNDRDDAKDIYQEVFLRVFRGLKKFQFKSEFSTWLYRITTNVCLTFIKSGKKQIMMRIDNDMETEAIDNIAGADDESNSPEEFLIRNEITNNVNKALEKLSSKQKMIFILKHFEGYKIREIAVMISCSEGTVKKYLFEANHKLRSHLSELYV
jgi:RNA polymerase sigma-70 factor (ECF subfamily)